jgi:outer membrane protein OmpA-like peptidoglycan-associated protein
LAGLAFAWLASGAIAQGSGPSWAEDLPGAKDHPLIQRFKDSWLYAYQQQPFDATRFPGKLGLGPRNEMLAPAEVEGTITRLLYLAPLGKTPVEVFRNYEQALTAAGFKPVVQCTPKVPKCDVMRYGFDDRYSGLKQVNRNVSQDRHPEGSPLYKNIYHASGGINMMGTEDIYFTYDTLTRGGTTVHVLVHTGKVYSTDFTGTYIEIAEPKAMTGGQVTVNADALQTGLKADGKIALYGIYFDTGKAEVKPESKAQLDEIAKLLKVQPALKVFLVGHTDNQGTLDANQALSQQRAQAVADALAKGYQIDARRFMARGVASLAPVASNAEEAGRARNRRVELVLP